MATRKPGSLAAPPGLPLQSRTAARWALGGALLAAGCLIYAREVETRLVEVKHVALTLPRLAPEFHGYRVVQLGDVHLDDWARPDRLKGTVALVNEQRPDLVAITGDFLSYSAGRPVPRRLTEALGGLRARDGVVAVLGNHDYKAGAALVRGCLRACGIAELANDVLTLRRGEAALHIAGVDDVMEGKARLDLVLGKLPESGAAVLLAHEPDFADVSAATGRFDLQLSGHSHGGQVRLPLLTRMILPPLSQRYTSGLYRVGDMAQYTNRGLGYVDARLRFLCRPEVTVLSLRSPQTRGKYRGGEPKGTSLREDITDA